MTSNQEHFNTDSNSGMNTDPNSKSNMNQEPLNTIAGDPKQPLKIGDIEIPCYVLEDETRVITKTGLFDSIGTSYGGSKVGEDEPAILPRFATRDWLKPFISQGLRNLLQYPILFKLPTGGRAAHGYRAEILVQVCIAISKARRKGTTSDQQEKMVNNASILLEGFAEVGIIALVDEATGYQEIRTKDNLANILKILIDKKLNPWVLTFPLEFYQQLYRLLKWDILQASSNKKSQYVAKLTNNLVYDRLVPGVREELNKKNPVIFETGRREHCHHQYFTPDIGKPKLNEHVASVIVLMKSSSNMEEFMERLDKALPKFK